MCKTVESPAVVLPTAIAVTAADCELNYAELDRWSNRLARMLLRLGAHPGARIAIAETPQLEAVVSRMAIAKTGATPVPLTTETTLARADFGITTKAGRELITDASRWLVLDDRSTLVQYLTGSDAPLTEAELQLARKAS
ncbi:AMP-binding protein [Nocardia seriolae]|uniref:Linear gramicidin synthase subunit B n=1 Tax=Nocardia seriolae TaxID=37332 RepID=A0A0B8NMH9_9NOCA|nr:AMP-binding protein [Nocardia seriolae]APB00407.1 Linear gramicidin synthase subunit B [Nocardia seriolae]MTJ62094.1 AMP-binding protein [Nocardia seriolae]MTJ75093.1 AMP-binding protein [Nocardia seriolae]MTJ89880.1 AMP-binding protein [Nocardia seriolae]MTK33855.1 AMP-binding protein [Nocardia seriolae]